MQFVFTSLKSSFQKKFDISHFKIWFLNLRNTRLCYKCAQFWNFYIFWKINLTKIKFLNKWWHFRKCFDQNITLSKLRKILIGVFIKYNTLKSLINIFENFGKVTFRNDGLQNFARLLLQWDCLISHFLSKTWSQHYFLVIKPQEFHQDSLYRKPILIIVYSLKRNPNKLFSINVMHNRVWNT